ncbi:MAG TPA: 50S ribosomal protein L24 [Firmicutes bacterium]|nr:50S ribosomal protein L24 [Bacillota bacterium]
MALIRPKVKKGDTVVVLSGKDKDRRGKVLRVLPREGKVTVEGINIIKRHTKPTRTAPQGGIIQRPAPLPISKVMVVCPKCGKPSRVARNVLADGSRVRVCRKCGQEIDAR